MQMLRFEVLLHVLPLCKALSVGFASRPQLWRPPVLLTASVGAPAADTLLRQLFADAGEATTVDASAVAAACAADVEWVDMGLPQPLRGRDAVQAHLASLHPAGSKLFIERLSDGARSGGMCWHREAEGVEGQQGLRGITYVELDEHGAISFVQEGYEPLFKLGKLLETIFKLVKPKGQAVDAKGYEQATPTDAEGIVRYLWYVAYPGGAEPAEALRFFAADCVYEDLNYQEPFVGEAQISEYFDLLPEIPNVVFVPGRISEGRRGCTFTWSVTVNGQDGPAGISFKEVDGDGKVAFNRDIPAPAWPRPVGRLAARLRPRLRTFRGRRSAAPRMGAGSAGDGAEALSVVETLKTRPTRSAMAATWVLFSLYVALASPGSFDLSPDSLDNQLIANSIADPSSLNPIFFFVFNALGLIPLINAALLLPGARDQPLPAAQFLAVSWVFGFGAIGPYLALRQPRPAVARDDLGFIARYVTEARLFGAVVLGLSLVLIATSLEPSAVAAAAAEFGALFATSKLVHVSTLDFAILCCFAFEPIREDMARRGWWGDSAAGNNLGRLLAFSAVPLVGPAAYLLLRPPLPEP